MSNWTNNAEGQVSGTALVANQTGSGDTLNSVSKVNTGAIIYSNAVSYRGTQSYRITGAAGDTSWLDYLITLGDFKGAIRAYVYFNALPAALGDFFQIRNTSSAGKIQINTTGKLILQNAASANLFTSTNSISLATWYRFELQVATNASTSLGTINFQYYLGESTTPIESFATSTTNAGTTAITDMRIGQITTTGNTTDVYVDEIAFNQGTITPVGPIDRSKITGLTSITGLSSITF